MMGQLDRGAWIFSSSFHYLGPPFFFLSFLLFFSTILLVMILDWWGGFLLDGGCLLGVAGFVVSVIACRFVLAMG